MQSPKLELIKVVTVVKRGLVWTALPISVTELKTTRCLLVTNPNIQRSITLRANSGILYYQLSIGSISVWVIKDNVQFPVWI